MARTSKTTIPAVATGRAPGRFLPGKAREDIRFGLGSSSLGSVLVALSDHGVVAILMGDETEELIEDLRERFPQANLSREDRECRESVARVVAFIEAPHGALDLPLDLRGTPFQKRVWQAVQKIPPGRTSTYSEIAHQIGAAKAIRAVGTACAGNKLAVAIPCHRVLHKDGSLSGGYYGTTGRQRALLDREAAGKVAAVAKPNPRRR